MMTPGIFSATPGHSVVFLHYSCSMRWPTILISITLRYDSLAPHANVMKR